MGFHQDLRELMQFQLHNWSMDLASQKLYIHESEALSPIKSPSTLLAGSPSHSSHTSFPIIAVAIIGILATGFLLGSYYIFMIKCCLNWHRIDLLRWFSFSRIQGVDDPLMAYSPMIENQGLDEAAIRSIPTIEFKKGKDKASERKSYECAVCLNEFQEEEKLRLIPTCGHAFHIDCIDVWLQNSANCPICRTSVYAISPDVRLPLDQMLPLSLPPQDPNCSDDFRGREEDYAVIEMGSEQDNCNPYLLRNQDSFNLSELLSVPKFNISKRGKILNRVSSMGDECIGRRQKDEQFAVQHVRRSFSMDSTADRKLNLAVQETIQQHRKLVIDIGPNEDCGSSGVRRSFFSFGQGRNSRSEVQPISLDP